MKVAHTHICDVLSRYWDINAIDLNVKQLFMIVLIFYNSLMKQCLLLIGHITTTCL